MITEYINRADVYNLIWGGKLISTSSTKAEDWVDTIPSVNVRPIIHGKWIDIEDKMIGINYRCSNCRRTTYTAKQYDIKGNEYVFEYCPHCGARMDGET